MFEKSMSSPTFSALDSDVDELFDLLINIGQHPKEKSDTVTVLEKIGHFLDVENVLLAVFFSKPNSIFLSASLVIISTHRRNIATF